MLSVFAWASIVLVLQFISKGGFLYKVIRREGDVSWDFLCCDLVSFVVLCWVGDVPKLPLVLQLLPWLCILFHGVSMLLMVYRGTVMRTNTGLQTPIWCRWPMLLVYSAMATGTVSSLCGANKWYLIFLYTGMFNIIPQVALLLQKPEANQWSTACLIGLSLLSWAIHVYTYVLAGHKVAGPQVMSTIGTVAAGLTSLLFWYRRQKRESADRMFFSLPKVV